MADPTETDPDKYSVVFENERVRVLEYRDIPGAKTHPHSHPDSVMITLSEFDRRLSVDNRQVDVTLAPHEIRWLEWGLGAATYTFHAQSSSNPALSSSCACSCDTSRSPSVHQR